MMRHYQAALVGLLAGIVGVVLALGFWHFYQDHLLIDAIRADLVQQRAGKAPMPIPPVLTPPPVPGK